MLSLFSPVPSVRSSVRLSGRFWANRLLLFSEILPKVATQYLVVHLRFSIFLKMSIPRFQPILAIFQGFSNILGKPRISFFSNFHTSSSRVIGYPLQQPIVCKKSSSWLKSRFCHQLVVDNLLFLAQIDDGSFANQGINSPPHENEKYELVYLRAIRK